MMTNKTVSMSQGNKVTKKTLLISALSVFLGVGAIAFLIYSLIQQQSLFFTSADKNIFPYVDIFASLILMILSVGLWQRKNWAKSALFLVISLCLVIYLITVVFSVSSSIFAGEKVMRLAEIGLILGKALWNLVLIGALPALVLYILQTSSGFQETLRERKLFDRWIRYILLVTALSSILIVMLIILFTLSESMDSILNIGLDNMLMGTIWRPGAITESGIGQYGLIPMILGTIISTIGATVLGVPLSIGTAILLAEVAPNSVRAIVRPAIELLAGIPSVVYGLFGMVVLAPLIRNIEVSHNSGFGILNASIILAVMIIPTVTNIAEDAIRAVPKDYKEGSLALGATKWQTIMKVILPSARSGIIAAVILGIGRALGETMAVIMVIGNSIAIPKPLDGNPLTLLLNTARTLTGNVAVEINYASGDHRSALFFTGILLFFMIMAVNQIARRLMRERTV
jgi:phosphate transport system permease protein